MTTMIICVRVVLVVVEWRDIISNPLPVAICVFNIVVWFY